MYYIDTTVWEGGGGGIRSLLWPGGQEAENCGKKIKKGTVVVLTLHKGVKTHGVLYLEKNKKKVTKRKNYEIINRVGVEI